MANISLPGRIGEAGALSRVLNFTVTVVACCYVALYKSWGYLLQSLPGRKMGFM
jgi:hypothetical protein